MEIKKTQAARTTSALKPNTNCICNRLKTKDCRQKQMTCFVVVTRIFLVLFLIQRVLRLMSFTNLGEITTCDCYDDAFINMDEVYNGSDPAS